MKRSIFEGIGAGIMIGIGGTIFLSCDSKVVGAVMFTVGLLSICLMGLQLFTGKVGFLVNNHSGSDIISVVGCLIGNAIGTFLSGIAIRFARAPIAEKAEELVVGKLNLNLFSVFLASIFCGILMYTAVYCYREKNTISAIIFCVPVFILSGFEHSIADMFYFFTALRIDIPSVIFILVVIVGNAVGGWTIPLIKNLAGK